MRKLIFLSVIISLVISIVLILEYKKVKTKQLYTFMYTTCALINKFYDEKNHFPSDKENLFNQIYQDNNQDKTRGIDLTNPDSADFKYELGSSHSYRVFIKSKSTLKLPAIECISNYNDKKISHICSIIE